MDQDYNPFLKPWRRTSPEINAGKGRIERPGEVGNIVWQTRAARPTEYQDALANAIIRAFDEGVTALPDMVAKLNSFGVLSPDGTPWTDDRFEAEMRRLGG